MKVEDASAVGTDFEQFDAVARGWIMRELPAIRARLLHAGLPDDCEWHPNGFAVARPDWTTPFPTVRLHIWPKGMKVVFPDHPPIHSHDRHITSLVLGGTYEDRLYHVGEAAAADPEALQMYDVRKPADRRLTGGDTLVAVNRFARVSEVERRVVEAGRLHGIPAGIAHETLMPFDGFCLTLSVKGPPIKRSWEFVVDRSGMPERLISRRQLTVEERSGVWRQVAPHLNGAEGRDL